MSKSLGNLVPLGDALDRFGASALRWYLLTPKYNVRIEWEEPAAEQAKIEMETFRRHVRSTLSRGQGGSIRLAELKRLVARVLRQFEDGFGVDGVFNELRDWSDRIGRAPVPRFERGAVSLAKAHYRRLERLLGLDLTGRGGPG